MKGELAKLVAFFGATVALGLGVVVLGPWLLGTLAGPENEILTELKRIERVGLDEPVAPRGRLRGAWVNFQRMSVAVEPSGEAALVTCTLDFSGHLRDGAEVSSLGLERIPFVRRGGAWAPAHGAAPRLVAILEALARAPAPLLAGADGRLPGAGTASVAYTPLAYFIRSERDEVLVSEDYRQRGHLPSRPVDERGTRRLVLRETGERQFSLPPGL